MFVLADPEQDAEAGGRVPFAALLAAVRRAALNHTRAREDAELQGHWHVHAKHRAFSAGLYASAGAVE